MTRPTEDKPATVPLAQQAGEILSRWRWVKPSAWTVRMLTTLEQGVEGGKWFRLFDKVFAERNLRPPDLETRRIEGCRSYLLAETGVWEILVGADKTA
jgi:hypothetical protein